MKANLLAGAAILVSCSGLLGQSPDALNHWQSFPAGATSMRGLAYRDGKFVAVGGTTNIYVSADGTSWVRAQSGLTNFFDGLLAVTDGAGKFVAVGGGGAILSSPDGLQWTRHREGLRPYEEFWAVTYGDGRFVAVGYENPGGAIAATSTDGILWEKFSLPINTTPRNVAYGSGRYVAVGSPVSMVSTNGRDWTALSGVLAQGVAFGQGQFVAVTGPLYPAYRSSNGVDWTQMAVPALGPAPGYYGNYYTASHANGLFIIGGWCDECPNADRPGLLATSPDGLDWTLRPLGAGAAVGAIRDILFIDGRFYLGDQSGKIWRSDPMPAVSQPVVTSITRDDDSGRAEVSFEAIAGYHYVMECADLLSANTTDWVRCAGPVYASGSQIRLSDLEATPSARFYRVRVQ